MSRSHRMPYPAESADRDAFLEGWQTQGAPDAGQEIERELRRADPKLGRIIDRVVAEDGPRRFKASGCRSHFDAIARSVIYQQLSKQAAATIYARYTSALGGHPDPDRVHAATPYRLRRTGLSAPKVRYLKATARAVVTGKIDLEQLEKLPDPAVIEQLTGLPGVGIWTAQMFLMFRLGRMDVPPVHDLGIQKGLQFAHGLRRPPAPRYIERVGRKWAPYRSIACLYLWAAVDRQHHKAQP